MAFLFWGHCYNKMGTIGFTSCGLGLVHGRSPRATPRLKIIALTRTHTHTHTHIDTRFGRVEVEVYVIGASGFVSTVTTNLAMFSSPYIDIFIPIISRLLYTLFPESPLLVK
jgi:hypothetical protein